jgi:hypothetical protein
MTKKDYELLAFSLRMAKVFFKSNTAHAEFVNVLSLDLEDDNPRFDRAKFIMASMPTWMKGSAKANVWERLARGDVDE